MSGKRKMTASEFDARIDAGESLEDLGVDLSQATRMVNVEFPLWVIDALDREATRRGIARQALIKSWIVDRIDALVAADSKAG